MLNRITNAVKSIEEIEALKKTIHATSCKIEEANARVHATEAELKKLAYQLSKKQEQSVQSFDETALRIHKLTADFEQELASFRTLKTQLHTDIVNRVSTEIKKELTVYLMNVKHEIEALHRASRTIEGMAQQTDKVLKSMDNVIAVGSSIKKQDFDLTKHAAVLRNNDREKLELMKKIDTLERLVSQMRRQQRSSQA